MCRKFSLKLALGAALTALFALSVACAAPAPTPTPVSPAPPAPPVAPTPAPAPTTAAIVAATPTPVPVQPTPTRVLPTATPAVADKPLYGGTLRYVTRLGLDTLDPHFNLKSDGYPFLFSIYNHLVQIDEDEKILPELARSWDVSADGLSITFHLEQGVKFHDGSAFGAEAVKWNFDRMLDPNEFSPRRAELGHVARVEVVNESTVTIRLAKPFRPFLSLLASERVGFLVSPQAVRKEGERFGSRPVGSGPFRFQEWVPDSHAILARNDGYWEKGRPYLDAIRVQAVPDSSAQLAMLRTGEAELLDSLEFLPANRPVVERDPKLSLIHYQSQLFWSLQFDVGRPPFDNRALRQAIGFSIDKENFVKVALVGNGRPGYSLLGKSWAHNLDIRPIVFDLNRARQRMVEAGYPEGVTIPIGCPTAGIRVQMCEILQAMMVQARIKAEAVVIPLADYTGPGPKGCLKRVGLCPFGSGHRVDPHISIERMYHSKGYFGSAQGYNNPEVDRLIDEAARTYDIAKAKALYDRIQAIAAEDAVLAFAAWADEFAAMSRKVRGFVVYPDKWYRFKGVWLAR